MLFQRRSDRDSSVFPLRKRFRDVNGRRSLTTSRRRAGRIHMHGFSTFRGVPTRTHKSVHQTIIKNNILYVIGKKKEEERQRPAAL